MTSAAPRQPAVHASPTQFAGAANDNLFKFAFTVMVTYPLSVGWLPSAMAGLVIGALFILPFLLFSATSGQLADKYDKTALIRFVKNLEIAFMLLAACGFYSEQVLVLLGCTFLMLRPAGRTYLEVKVLYSPGKGKS